MHGAWREARRGAAPSSGKQRELLEIPNTAVVLAVAAEVAVAAVPVAVVAVVVVVILVVAVAVAVAIVVVVVLTGPRPSLLATLSVVHRSSVPQVRGPGSALALAKNVA